MRLLSSDHATISEDGPFRYLKTFSARGKHVRLTLERNKKRVAAQEIGCKDEWRAEVEGFPVPGIGKTRAEAISALLRGNLERFDITELVDRDSESTTPETVWKSRQVSPDHG
jgi:hypothetical protein